MGWGIECKIGEKGLIEKRDGERLMPGSWGRGRAAAWCAHCAPSLPWAELADVRWWLELGEGEGWSSLFLGGSSAKAMVVQTP